MMKHLASISFIILLAVIANFTASCKKKNFGDSDGNLDFSRDTIVFDTVFTTIGSTTAQFKVYNRDNKTITIDEIELAGGAASPFEINFDGLQGTQFSNIQIEGGDSLFCFVEVTLSTNGGNLPLVVEDSIRFRCNGVDQYVKLAVWGQDAYFHYNDTNEGTWPNDKPHVIYGYAGIDTDKTLTIQQDTKVYLHKGSLLYVYEGTLHVDGAYQHEVIFQGDRLEEFYDNVPGQYYGIYFERAKSSTINYAVIKNGTAGIHIFDNNVANTGYTVTVTNTKITNNASYGLFLFAGGKVKAENCLIAKNGVHAMLLLQGGDFNINHCDLLGYSSQSNQTPAVGIRNYYFDSETGNTNVGQVNEGKIYNSVIYGNEDSEIVFDTINPGGVNLNFDFRRTLIKKETIETTSAYQNIIWNSDPQFNNVGTNDFLFPFTSPLNGTVNPLLTPPSTPSVTTSINNVPRPPLPDLGAYEAQ